METSHSVIDSSTALQEAQAAQREFTAEFAAFCRVLDIAPGVLEKLPVNTTLMFVTMRVFKRLSLKLRELDARLAALEEPSKALRRPLDPSTCN